MRPKLSEMNVGENAPVANERRDLLEKTAAIGVHVKGMADSAGYRHLKETLEAQHAVLQQELRYAPLHEARDIPDVRALQAKLEMLDWIMSVVPNAVETGLMASTELRLLEGKQ